MSSARILTLTLVASIAAACVCGATGCASRNSTNDQVVPVETSSSASADRVPSREILMMGRSVMWGWFEHWGAADTGTASKAGYRLKYVELDTPPRLGSSAATAIRDADARAIVFFKPCFADFWAGSEQEVDENVAELIGYVEAVVSAAEKRDCTVILGTALPQTTADTNPYLVQAHRRYNAALKRMAEGRRHVVVFDLYGILADSSGSLRADFAVGPYDAHLTDAAYDALDAAFIPFLENLK